jgi:hypothetical protein
METNEPVEVFSSFNSAEAEIVRAMLDAEGIDADVAGETQGGFSGALAEVSVLVHADDANRARELIASHQAQRPKSDEED